jgi:hypothetical protein
MVCGTSDAQPPNAAKSRKAPAVRRAHLYQAGKSGITVSDASVQGPMHA